MKNLNTQETREEIKKISLELYGKEIQQLTSLQRSEVISQWINKKIEKNTTKRKEGSKMENNYRILAENKSEERPCTNCAVLISYDDIAKEIKGSSLEEIICQDCWDEEE